MILRTILALLFGFSLAMAQNQTLSTPRPSTLVPPVRPFRLPPRTGIETQMEISLDQTLAMALANNKDIESSRIDREESDYVLTAAQGAYDPTLNVTSYWEQQINPIASSLGGSSTGSLINKTWLADPGITQPLPWFGGTFKTDLSSADAYSNNSFLSLNPQYETSLNFSYTQPLWRNLLYDSNRHQIDVAKKNRSLTDQQFRQRVMAVVLQAEQAYWELSYAYNNLQVQLDAVRIRNPAWTKAIAVKKSKGLLFCSHRCSGSANATGDFRSGRLCGAIRIDGFRERAQGIGAAGSFRWHVVHRHDSQHAGRRKCAG